jgi:hypothetical protein
MNNNIFPNLRELAEKAKERQAEKAHAQAAASEKLHDLLRKMREKAQAQK